MTEAAFIKAFGIPTFNRVKKEMKEHKARAFIYQVDFRGIPCLMAVTFRTGNAPPQLPPEFYSEGDSFLVGEVGFGRTYSDSDDT
jgi:hypothetical protein